MVVGAALVGAAVVGAAVVGAAVGALVRRNDPHVGWLLVSSAEHCPTIPADTSCSGKVLPPPTPDKEFMLAKVVSVSTSSPFVFTRM